MGFGLSIWEGGVDDVMIYVWEVGLLDIMNALGDLVGFRVEHCKSIFCIFIHSHSHGGMYYDFLTSYPSSSMV
jgi:hypothetical protein